MEIFTDNVIVFSEQLTNGGDVVTDSALKELEARNKAGPTQTSKSTLIIHSVQRVSTIANIHRIGLECGVVLISAKGFALKIKGIYFRWTNSVFWYCVIVMIDFSLCVFFLIMHLI